VEGVRYVDVLVIEGRPPAGQLPRVETFSFKSRDLSLLEPQQLREQMRMDASDALRYYGGKLDIRRPSLELRGTVVPVHRIRLIYEGGELKPKDPKLLRGAVDMVKRDVKGVEVLFQ
jgi:hypothetical protein